MAQRAITSAEPVELDGEFEDVTEIVDDNKRAEDDISAELGAPENNVEHKIIVYRVPDTGKTLVNLFDIRGESVAGLADRLRTEYGNGLYQARVFRNGKLARRLQIAVELPKTAPTPTRTASDDALTIMVTRHGALLETALRELAEIKRAPPTPAPTFDPLAMFAQVSGMAKAMRDMMGPAPTAADPMAMLTQAVQLVQGLQNEGREKGAMDMIGEVLNSDLVKTVAQNFGQPRQPVAPPQLPAPTHAPGQPRPQQSASPPQASATAPAPTAAPVPTLDDFSAFLNVLVISARNNADVGLWADVVENTLDPDTIAQMLAMSDPVGLLAAQNAGVATHREWFAALVAALREGGDGLTDDEDRAKQASARQPADVEPNAVGIASLRSAAPTADAGPLGR